MGLAETAIFILVGIAVMAGVAIAVQTAETNRQERRLRVLAIRDQIRRAEHLLENLPGHVQYPDLRLLLITYLEKCWRRILQYESNTENKRQLEALTNVSSNPPENSLISSGGITLYNDRNSAAKAKALVREMAQMLTDLERNGYLQPETTRFHMQRMKDAHTQLTCDLELMDAQETLKNAGSKVAVHQFRSILLKLQRLNARLQVDSQVFAINHLIEQMERKIAAEEEEQPTSSDDENSSSGTV
ncbi:hypothetical protein [Nitrincola alkalilacustris]|uniref:hypothetical protein n=1 Tax=Nitrincola alkalilacustris TaxID=1571224 RepID=UPI001456C7C6|nr:hypothetical protein [Nitrincola alkalilacustris]